MWTLENNFWQSVLSFHHESKDHTQFVRLVRHVLLPAEPSHWPHNVLMEGKNYRLYEFKEGSISGVHLG